MYSIYSLNNPDGSTFYIGMTNNLKNRFDKHRSEKKNSEKYLHIRSLINSGSNYSIKSLKETNDVYLAQLMEIEYIELFKYNGANLFNVSDGGLNPPSKKGFKHSKESIKKCFENSTLKKKVYQYSKLGNFINEFEGVREAYRITGIDHRSIAQVAGGSKTRKSAGSYVWKYEKGGGNG